MRKVEQQLVEALRFRNNTRAGIIFNRGNTTVEIVHHGIHGTFDYDREVIVKLHGNPIARLDLVDNLEISTAGWCTATTCSRLSAILSHYRPDYRINRCKGSMILSKMVPVTSRAHYGDDGFMDRVPCSAVKVAEVGDGFTKVGKGW